MNEKKSISLMSLGVNQNAEVAFIDAGKEAAKRLADLGLTPSTPVKVLKKTLFFGPIEIEARGCKLALGRGIASKIWVKEI